MFLQIKIVFKYLEKLYKLYVAFKKKNKSYLILKNPKNLPIIFKQNEIYRNK